MKIKLIKSENIRLLEVFSKRLELRKKLRIYLKNCQKLSNSENDSEGRPAADNTCTECFKLISL